MIFIFSFFIALELFEVNWQKADSLFGLLRNNYKIYEKNIFLYFIMNPTFFYVLYLAVSLNNFSFWMNSIIVMKFLDISFRLYILNAIYNDKDIKHIIPLDINMSIYLRYMNLIIYLPMLFFALINL